MTGDSFTCLICDRQYTNCNTAVQCCAPHFDSVSDDLPTIVRADNGMDPDYYK
jgi:hypothetical protein